MTPPQQQETETRELAAELRHAERHLQSVLGAELPQTRAAIVQNVAATMVRAADALAAGDGERRRLVLRGVEEYDAETMDGPQLAIGLLGDEVRDRWVCTGCEATGALAYVERYIEGQGKGYAFCERCLFERLAAASPSTGGSERGPDDAAIRRAWCDAGGQVDLVNEGTIDQPVGPDLLRRFAAAVSPGGGERVLADALAQIARGEVPESDGPNMIHVAPTIAAYALDALDAASAAPSSSSGESGEAEEFHRWLDERGVPRKWETPDRRPMHLVDRARRYYEAIEHKEGPSHVG